MTVTERRVNGVGVDQLGDAVKAISDTFGVGQFTSDQAQNSDQTHDEKGVSSGIQKRREKK